MKDDIHLNQAGARVSASAKQEAVTQKEKEKWKDKKTEKTKNVTVRKTDTREYVEKGGERVKTMEE